MNLSVSPQMRVVAIVGLVSLLGLALALFTFGRMHSSSSSSSTSSTPVRAHHRSKPAATPPTTATRPAAKSTPKRTAPAAKRVAPKVPVVVRAALDQGWPKPIAKAFAHNRVVVAVLYSSESALDRDALAEATAGAGLTGVPVVSLDVSAKADAATRKVLQKLGVLDSPTTLVLQRPGKLFVQFDGTADKDTVAQAVANAALPSLPS